MAIVSHYNSKVWMGLGERSKGTKFSGKKSCSFWKLSSSYLFDVLTFVLVGYRKLINCSKLQHSEMIEISVIGYSRLGNRIVPTTQSITHFSSPRGALYNHNFHKVCLRYMRK